MTFGERLKFLREERELRQQDVAKSMNISARMIGYYESNRHFPSDANMIIELADYFNVSLDYLFGVSNIRNNETKNKFERLVSDLSDENKNNAIEYMEFLKNKQKK